MAHVKWAMTSGAGRLWMAHVKWAMTSGAGRLWMAHVTRAMTGRLFFRIHHAQMQFLELFG
jgi:hypothetical protein